MTSCAIAENANEMGKTNMFRALEPTIKAEASTRRALENCIVEKLVFLVLSLGSIVLMIREANV